MRFRNTLIALVALVIIGGYALIIRLYSRPVEGRTALKVKAAEIAKIDLKYPDRELVIERKLGGGPWMIANPIGVKADQTAANNLARAIADCAITKTVEEQPADLARFGLAKPRVIVTVTTVKGNTLPGIEVGKSTPVGFSAYIKLTDKPAVMLASSAFQSGMNKTVDQMRDRELMALKVDDVNKFTIDEENRPEIEVDRDQGQWKIVKPAQYAADPTQVRQLLSALAGAKVADFISDAPADVAQYGLQKPRLALTVYTRKAGNGQESLLFGSNQKDNGKDGIYVRRGDRAPVYTVPPWVLTSVDKSLLDLRDKTVVSIEPSAVETAEVRLDGKEFTLKRAAGGKWDLIRDGKTSQADTAAVEAFLDRIHDLRGESIVMDPMSDPQALGMDRPALVFKFVGKDTKSLGEVKLAKVEVKNLPAIAPGQAPTSGTDYYVTSSTSTAAFSTDQFTFDQLNKSVNRMLPESHPAATASPSVSAH